MTPQVPSESQQHSASKSSHGQLLFNSGGIWRNCFRFHTFSSFSRLGYLHLSTLGDSSFSFHFKVTKTAKSIPRCCLQLQPVCLYKPHIMERLSAAPHEEGRRDGSALQHMNHLPGLPTGALFVGKADGNNQGLRKGFSSGVLCIVCFSFFLVSTGVCWKKDRLPCRHFMKMHMNYD